MRPLYRASAGYCEVATRLCRQSADHAGESRRREGQPCESETTWGPRFAVADGWRSRRTLRGNRNTVGRPDSNRWVDWQSSRERARRDQELGVGRCGRWREDQREWSRQTASDSDAVLCGITDRRQGAGSEPARRVRSDDFVLRLQGPQDPGSLLESRLQLLPANAARFERVGNQPTEKRTGSPRCLDRHEGGEQRNGAALASAARPSLWRRAAISWRCDTFGGVDR